MVSPHRLTKVLYSTCTSCSCDGGGGVSSGGGGRERYLLMDNVEALFVYGMLISWQATWCYGHVNILSKDLSKLSSFAGHYNI